MQSSIRRKLEMAARVRDFSRAHPLSDPSHAAVATRFEERLTRAQSLAVQEQGGRLDAAAASRHRKEVRRGVQQELMRYLTRLGTVAGRDHPDLVGRFRSPQSNGSNAAFLAQAWDMLNLAKTNRDLLGSYGLGGGQLDELASGLNQFEAAAEKANAGRRDHVGDRAELLNLGNELMDLVGLLDVLNRTRFRAEAELLAAWESARNVANPFRVKQVQPENGGGTPPTDGGIGKAA